MRIASILIMASIAVSCGQLSNLSLDATFTQTNQEELQRGDILKFGNFNKIYEPEYGNLPIHNAYLGGDLSFNGYGAKADDSLKKNFPRSHQNLSRLYRRYKYFGQKEVPNDMYGQHDPSEPETVMEDNIKLQSDIYLRVNASEPLKAGTMISVSPNNDYVVSRIKVLFNKETAEAAAPEVKKPTLAEVIGYLHANGLEVTEDNAKKATQKIIREKAATALAEANQHLENSEMNEPVQIIEVELENPNGWARNTKANISIIAVAYDKDANLKKDIYDVFKRNFVYNGDLKLSLTR